MKSYLHSSLGLSRWGNGTLAAKQIFSLYRDSWIRITYLHSFPDDDLWKLVVITPLDDESKRCKDLLKEALFEIRCALLE